MTIGLLFWEVPSLLATVKNVFSYLKKHRVDGFRLILIHLFQFKCFHFGHKLIIRTSTHKEEYCILWNHHRWMGYMCVCVVRCFGYVEQSVQHQANLTALCFVGRCTLKNNTPPPFSCVNLLHTISNVRRKHTYICRMPKEMIDTRNNNHSKYWWATVAHLHSIVFMSTPKTAHSLKKIYKFN